MISNPWKVIHKPKDGRFYAVRSNGDNQRGPFLTQEVAEQAAVEWNRIERVRNAAEDLLSVCKQIRKELGIRHDFAPLGTLDFASNLLNAIDKAEGQNESLAACEKHARKSRRKVGAR